MSKTTKKITPKATDSMAKLRAFVQTEEYQNYAKEEDEKIAIAVLVARLKQIRKAKKLTQKKLGEIVGDKQSQVARWENATDIPNVKTLLRICAAIGGKLEIIY